MQNATNYGPAPALHTSESSDTASRPPKGAAARAARQAPSKDEERSAIENAGRLPGEEFKEEGGSAEEKASRTPEERAVSILNQAGPPMTDEDLPNFDDYVEKPNSSTTDAGFFPLMPGNVLIGRVVAVDQISGQYGKTEVPITINLPGGGTQTQVAKMQKVILVKGTAKIMMKSRDSATAMAVVQGTFKLNGDHERVTTSLAPYIADRSLVAKITYVGQQPGRKDKKGDEKDGAHCYDVVQAQRARR